MQIKKSCVQSLIDRAALRMFSSSGFSRTSMADIARVAGISVGNIYRYYESKEELFYCLVPRKLVEAGRALLVEKVRSAHGLSIALASHSQGVIDKQEEFLAFLAKHRLPMLIAFRHGDGTEYEGLSEEVLGLIEKLVVEYITNSIQKRKPVLSGQKKEIVRIVYSHLIQGTLDILDRYSTEKAIQSALEQYLSYHFAGLEKILGM